MSSLASVKLFLAIEPNSVASIIFILSSGSLFAFNISSEVFIPAKKGRNILLGKEITASK